MTRQTTEKSIKQTHKVGETPLIYWLAFAVATGAGALLMCLYIAPLLGIGYLMMMLSAVMLVLRPAPPTTGMLGVVWRGVLVIHRYRVAISRIIGLGALGMMSVAALLLSVGKMKFVSQGYDLVLLGGGMLIVALVLGRVAPFAQPFQLAEKRRDRPKFSVIHAIGLTIGLILLVALTEINADILNIPFLKGVTPYVQSVLLILGVGLTAWGAGGTSSHTRREQDSAPSLSSGRGPGGEVIIQRHNVSPELLALTVILLIATFARAYALGDGVRLFVDEIHFTNPIRHFDLADDIELLLPFSSVAAFPYLYPFMEWNAVQVFGHTLVGLRVVSAGFGVLGVLALYLLARELFDKKTALIAAALLAVFPPHLQFSRLGLNNIADPFFGTMMLYFIMRGLRRPDAIRLNFAWAGAMLGLTQYFYEGGRLLFPALVIGWLLLIGVAGYITLTARLLWGWLTNERKIFAAALRRIESLDFAALARALGALFFMAFVVAAPVYITLLNKERDVVQRLETAGLRPVETEQLKTLSGMVGHIYNRLNESLLIHLSIPEAGLYYAGNTSLLLGVLAIFFLIGAVVILWRLLRPSRNPAAPLLILWLLLTWLGNTLLTEGRISARYVVEFPALILIVAVGIRSMMTILLPCQPKAQNRLMVALVGALMVAQFQYFFGSHLSTFSSQFRGTPNRGHDIDDALLRSADFPDGTYVHVVDTLPFPNRDAMDLMAYLNGGVLIHTMSPPEFTDSYLQMLPVDHDHAFYIVPEDKATLARIQRYFPTVTGPLWSDYPLLRGREFALYYVTYTVGVMNEP